MKAKYDLERLHADCLKWCEKPVFLPWQERWGLLWEDLGWVLKDGHGKHRAFIYHMPDEEEDSNLYFAHLIGLNVESYRIKETYKSAVERYLSTIPEGQPLWEGSPFTKQTYLLSPPVIWASYLENKAHFHLTGEWMDDAQSWFCSYYFLRLDQNPDYKID